MSEFSDQYWTSRDGLKLHYRDYPGPGGAERAPVLCLPGLTRNARDFEKLAVALSGERRVLCPDMRGRGDSAYSKDSATYNPLQYVEDVTALLDEAGIPRFVAVGTSLGGLMTLVLAATAPQRIAGAVLNDVGCDQVQGFLLGRPVRAGEFERLYLKPGSPIAQPFH